jgi:Ca2+-binding EF-hand superfamily protein
MSEAEMRIGFEEVDTDRDGFIDRREFFEWWSAD